MRPNDSIGRSRPGLESAARLRAPTTRLRTAPATPATHQRLGVELRHARLGHAEHLADLLHGQLVPVVEGEDAAPVQAGATDGGGHQRVRSRGRRDGQGLVRFRLCARQSLDRLGCHRRSMARPGRPGRSRPAGRGLRDGEPERGRELLAPAGRTPETPLRVAARPPHRAAFSRTLRGRQSTAATDRGWHREYEIARRRRIPRRARAHSVRRAARSPRVPQETRSSSSTPMRYRRARGSRADPSHQGADGADQKARGRRPNSWHGAAASVVPPGRSLPETLTRPASYRREFDGPSSQPSRAEGSMRHRTVDTRDPGAFPSLGCPGRVCQERSVTAPDNQIIAAGARRRASRSPAAPGSSPCREAAFLDAWLADGRAGEMAYLDPPSTGAARPAPACPWARS